MAIVKNNNNRANNKTIHPSSSFPLGSDAVKPADSANSAGSDNSVESSKFVASVASSDSVIVAFQGVKAAHSDEATKIAFPNCKTLACHNFEDVFTAIEDGTAQYGMIPIENSYAGRVAEIHNLLPKVNLFIVGEYIHNVNHCLLATKGASLDSIRQVFSHNQALMQCRNNILKHGLSPHIFADTAGAAKYIAEKGNKELAAIASKTAAQIYGLEILQENFNDAENNKTLFLKFAKQLADPDPKDGKILTSLIFTTRDISACLYKALGGFATNNINLVKIESYLNSLNGNNSNSGFNKHSKDNNTAEFFLSFEGNPAEENVAMALQELGFFSKKVKVLGIYNADKNR